MGTQCGWWFLYIGTPLFFRGGFGGAVCFSFSGGLFWCQEKRIIKECLLLSGLKLLSFIYTLKVCIAVEQLSSDAVENTGLVFKNASHFPNTVSSIGWCLTQTI